MIKGVGVDIVLISRVHAAFDRFGLRFARKILSATEVENCDINARFLAKRFAAKEAIVKALGTGFRGGITMPAITVSKSELNQPLVILSGPALARLEAIGASEIMVSISDEVDSVIAFAIAQ